MSEPMNELQRTRLREHVIAALDVDTAEQAEALVRQLSPWIDKFKIGSRMFTAEGPSILDRLGALDAKVFLDLKYHDIPSVVGDACRIAAGHESVFLMTIHAAGGSHMIARAVEGARAGRAGQSDPPQVVAVTALTSISAAEMHTLGIGMELVDWAEKLALTAIDAGADGIVCSAAEAERFRGLLGDGPTFVTPGIRPQVEGQDHGDQVRVMTPKAGLDAGSSYLVIGRPIYKADDPVAAVHAIGASL